MFAILKFLFLLLLTLVLFAGLFVWGILSQLRRGVRKFMQGGAAGQTSRQPSGAEGETVVDRRDPTTARKKIIPQDEGEYVDFTEEQSPGS